MSLAFNSSSFIRVKLFNRFSDGFGLVIEKRSSQPPTLMITDLIQGGEAQTSGLIRPGDIIVKINEIDVSNCSYEAAINVYQSLEKGRMFYFLIRPPFGSRTHLETTFSKDGTPQTYRITEKLDKEHQQVVGSLIDSSLPLLISNINLQFKRKPTTAR